MYRVAEVESPNLVDAPIHSYADVTHTCTETPNSRAPNALVNNGWKWNL